MSTLAKNVVVYYQKQVGDFEATFVRKHPLAPGLQRQTYFITLLNKQLEQARCQNQHFNDTDLLINTASVLWLLEPFSTESDFRRQNLNIRRLKSIPE